MDGQEAQIVVAIDIGTTYSGYAISTLSDYNTDPLKIITQQWSSDEMCTEKTPTCILFDNDQKFHSFGYDAARKYAELAEKEIHKGWRFFKHFKLTLMKAETQRLKRNMTIKDDQGQSMRALQVFSASIRFMKDTVWQRMKDAIMDLRETDIHWVLTVPAIWEDGAKQFMRIAANEAGIKDDQLMLALEPEAAAIYCKQTTTQRNDTSLTSFQPGTKFLLLDLGGGTVDCVVEQVEENGQLTDIHYPDGGPWGGTLVDKAYKQFLVEVFGKAAMEKFSNENKTDELFVNANFEIKKRNISKATSGDIRIRLTMSLVDCADGRQAVQRRIDQSEYNGKVDVNPDKLIMDSQVFVNLFSESKEKLIGFVRELFEEDEVNGINIVLLVGGFASCSLIVDAVKKAFTNKIIIVPTDANMAILKGAVLYGRQTLSLNSQGGQDSAVISARRLRHTYGIGTLVPFDAQIHPLIYMRISPQGLPQCDNIFHVFFKAGQRVVPGQTSETCAFNPTANCIEVYRTRSRDPRYVLDEGTSATGGTPATGGTSATGVEVEPHSFGSGSFMVGRVVLESYDRNGGEINVRFHAGGTELIVEAQQAGTDTPTRARFNFLI